MRSDHLSKHVKRHLAAENKKIGLMINNLMFTSGLRAASSSASSAAGGCPSNTCSAFNPMVGFDKLFQTVPHPTAH